MPAPYDYSVGDVASPMQSFLQGLQISDALQQRQQSIADAERARAAEQQRLQLLQGFTQKIANRTATDSDFAAMMALDPKSAEGLNKSLSAYNTGQKKALFDRGLPIYAALHQNTPESIAVAKNELRKQIKASEESNPEQAKALQNTLDMIEAGVPDAAYVQVGSVMQAADPEAFGKIGEELRARKLAPITERRSAAEAAKSEVDAEFARKEKLAALDKAAAELGLSQANKNKVLAETRKLGIETQQAALALEALKTSGGVDPTKKFEQEEKIRKEWQGRSKVYGELQGTFNTLQESASASSGPGDIALITGFMKMLDPGSVVRETEFATARDTGGLYIQLQNKLEKAKNGQFLNPAQRKEYLDLAKKYLESAQKKAEKEKQDLGAVVKNYNLNPENVFGVTKNITVDY